jgi:hypothetical protein
VVTPKVKKALEAKENHKKLKIRFSLHVKQDFFKTVVNIPRVTQLQIYSRKTSDLTPRAKLKNLKWLNMTTLATDLSPISGLTGLTTLTMQRHHFSDLSALKGLTNVTHCGLSR